MKFKLESGICTDVGQIRKVNEDFAGVYQVPQGELYIVCDGMGGYAGGKIAAAIAAEAISTVFSNHGPNDNIPDIFFEAYQTGNLAIKHAAEIDPDISHMGSTAVAMVISNDKAYIANIGDSRIYLIRDGSLVQLTKDHSLVQSLVDLGILRKSRVSEHPQKNVITRSLGSNKDDLPDVFDVPIDLLLGDTFVLCTDGLTQHIEDAEIEEIASQKSPADAVYILVDWANQRGGQDNITALVVKVVDSLEENKSYPNFFGFLKDKKAHLIITFIVISLILVFFGLNRYFACQENKKNTDYFLPNNESFEIKKPFQAFDAASKPYS